MWPWLILALLFTPSGFLTLWKFLNIWLSNLLTLNIPDGVYISQLRRCAQVEKHRFYMIVVMEKYKLNVHRFHMNIVTVKKRITLMWYYNPGQIFHGLFSIKIPFLVLFFTDVYYVLYLISFWHFECNNYFIEPQ